MPEINTDSISNLSPELQKAYQASIKAERKPIQNLEEKKDKVGAKLDLLNDVIGKVDTVKALMPGLTSPFAIRDLAFNSDDAKVISGSADKSIANPGKHSLEVLSLARGPAALSNSFADKDETRVGTGYITFETKDGDTREVFIDYDNSTLDGIAKSINQARVGMHASVINDQTDPEYPYKLIITSPNVGASEDVTFPEFYFAGGEEDFYIESKKDASNAVVKFQGFQFESPTNEIRDLVDGAIINLKGVTDPGKPVTISIEQDIPKTSVKIKDVVEKLNQVFSFIQQQNTMDEKTDTSRTLGGDYSLKLAEGRLRSALSQNFLFDESGRTVRSLADVGIQFNRKGSLNFDEKKFQSALETHYDEVVEFFAGDGVSSGVMTKLNQALTSLSSSAGGLLSGQKRSMTTEVTQIDKKIADTEKVVASRSETLKGQLARAQTALNSLQSQSGAIQSGGTIPGIG